MKLHGFVKLFLFRTLGIFLAAIFLFTVVVNVFVTPLSAKCPENVVPNPLDPNCDASSPITLGSIVGRVVVFVPYATVAIATAMFIWGALLVITGKEDERGKSKGIQIWINTALGLVLMFSIWLVLFIISLFTGVDLLSFIGQ